MAGHESTVVSVIVRTEVRVEATVRVDFGRGITVVRDRVLVLVQVKVSVFVRLLISVSVVVVRALVTGQLSELIVKMDVETIDFMDLVDRLVVVVTFTVDTKVTDVDTSVLVVNTVSVLCPSTVITVKEVIESTMMVVWVAVVDVLVVTVELADTTTVDSSLTVTDACTFTVDVDGIRLVRVRVPDTKMVVVGATGGNDWTHTAYWVGAAWHCSMGMIGGGNWKNSHPAQAGVVSCTHSTLSLIHI